MGKKTIKIVTIGGGSSYTPELMEGFIKRGIPIKEIWLVDIEEGQEKQEIVGRMAQRMWDASPYDVKVHMTLDRREALASVVTGPVCGNPPFRTLYLRGPDPALRYRAEGGAAYSGAALMEGGYPLPMELLMGDYQSFQLYLKAE